MADTPQKLPRKGSAPPGAPSKGPAQTGRCEPDFDLHALEETPAVHRERPQRAQQPKSQSASRGTGRGGSGIALIAIVMTVLVAATGFWQLHVLKRQMATVQSSLDSMNMLSENQYESLQEALDSADEQRGKWGKEVNEKLTFLDGEMRKLWVIAHQTNQPQIKKLESEVAGMLKTAESLKGKVAVNVKQLKAHDTALAKIQAEEVSLQESLETVKSLETTVAEQRIRLDDVPVAIEALKLQLLEFESKSEETAKLIKQLDQYRGQVNRSIDQLTEEIRQLKGGASQPGL